MTRQQTPLLDLLVPVDDVLLAKLASNTARTALSMYLHPTDNPASDRIKIRHLLDAAEADGVALGCNRAELANLIPTAEQTAELLERTQRGTGIAIFADDIDMKVVALARHGSWFAKIGNGFDLVHLLAKPLRDTWFVLALSNNHVRLLRIDNGAAVEVNVPSIPHSLAESSKHLDHEKQLQSHSSTRSARGRAGATFHGQGSASDDRAAAFGQYIGKVAKGVDVALSGELLVLAGGAKAVAEFRAHSHYAAISSAAVDTNPDPLTDEALMIESEPIIVELRRMEESALLEQLSSAIARGRAVTGPAAVLSAATAGAAEAILVHVTQSNDGTATEPPDSGSDKGRADLNDALVAGYNTGAKVVQLVDSVVPDGIAATLRFDTTAP